MKKTIDVFWHCQNCGYLNEDIGKNLKKVKCTRCGKEFNLDDLFTKGEKIITEEIYDNKGNILKVIKKEMFYRTHPLVF